MPRSSLPARFVNLKSLIVFLAFLVALITLVNGFYASYKVQRSQLIKNTLDTNHAYAQKLASATDNFIDAAHEQLAFSAKIIAGNLKDKLLLMREAERLYVQTKSFNSVTVVNSDGVVLAAAPNTLDIVGSKLLVGGGIESLQVQKPLVSTPYLSEAGNYLILISNPIFAPSGKYLGYVGGSIYLKKTSILNELLGRHFHHDGSYIYVVDRHKQIIYHPEPERVGAYVLDNAAINSVTENMSGSTRTINSKGIDMLAGFAPITSANWGVVAQRPVTATLSSLDELMQEVAYRTVPLALFTFIFIWILASYISRPLRQLATTAIRINAPDAHAHLTRVKSWYLEIYELKQAMLKGVGIVSTQISQLKQDAAIDPLTGAVNRRSLQQLLDKLAQQNIPFSALAVDIDHFKKVNDTFGHPAGDKVLIALVQVISKLSREHDVVARTGGEEFLLILPNTPIHIAQIIAERLRTRVAEMQIEPIGSINVSIGIAATSESNNSSEDVLNQADEALYRAKSLGRNRCEVFTS